jgi:hypothetical protein
MLPGSEKISLRKGLPVIYLLPCWPIALSNRSDTGSTNMGKLEEFCQTSYGIQAELAQQFTVV